ncbi:hypothetical protein [Furfurilactobacillus rossiae]|uniref:hypothetical protein n=1 Tax=Furfurilactobacillus rossiae TaxID=231049 RepID=UPI0015BDCF51|nr:hypothetical protein [Furfurilactobacillus rossiae]
MPELGHLCGYVELPSKHPYYGSDYEDIPVDVHGGLTYAMQNEEYWEIGFDCAHLGDIIPGLIDHISALPNEHYWTIQDVEHELYKLVDQLDRLQPRKIKLENTNGIEH